MVRLFRKRESDPAARPRANWKAGSGQIDALIHSVEPRQVIRTGIAASAIAHLSVLMLVLLFADVRPLGSLTDEPVAVEIVTPEEVAESKREEPPLAAQPKPSDVADTSAKPAAPIPPPPTAPEPVAQPKKRRHRRRHVQPQRRQLRSHSRSHSRNPHRRRRRLTRRRNPIFPSNTMCCSGFLRICRWTHRPGDPATSLATPSTVPRRNLPTSHPLW